MSSTLDKFLALSVDLSLAVRERAVPADEDFDRLEILLATLADEYRGRDSLPKPLVGVMLDLSTALYSAADGNTEPSRSILYAHFDALTAAMRDLCD